MDAGHPPSPLVLTRRLPPAEPGPGVVLRLRLSAEERTRLRGLRHSVCGRRLLLQLPRGEALKPGERLRSDAGNSAEEPTEVVVEAAAEALLVVRADEAESLARAAYHLGNRHVALEVRDRELRLLDDPVLADLLRQLGLQPERRQLPFLPEGGAYGGGTASAHGHPHGHGSASAASAP